jgi:serine/threonine protein kinase
MPFGLTNRDSDESSDSSSSSKYKEEEEESTWGPQVEDAEQQDTDRASWQEPNESSPPDKERQLLLLMLLAQVCALHDPTPRTFTVHVLELFERGILDRESIRFLFELGLVPQQPLLKVPNVTEHTNEEISNALAALTNSPKNNAAVTVTPRVMSLEDVRAQEASAIRSHLEEKAALPASFHPSSSWAVEHHPLSLSRYQREFRQVHLLNSGSFGHVYQATNLMDGRDYAIKRVAFGATGYSSDSVTQAVREVQCLAHVDHPHTVRYYTSWLEPSWMTGSGSAQPPEQRLLTHVQHMVGVSSSHVSSAERRSSTMSRRFSFTGQHSNEEEDNVSDWSFRSKDDSFLGSFQGSLKPPSYRYEICLFIQMELCNPSTLADWIRQRNLTCTTHEEPRAGPAIHIFSQLVSGIQHIHENGILHRDLKPANIFLGDDGRFKIGDFGLSKLLRTGGRDFCEPTLPPINKGNSRDPLTAGIGTASYAAPEQLESRTYGPEADVFSMGLILLELFCNFGTEHERIDTFHDCRRQKLPLWLLEKYPEASSIILKCTQSNPAKRPTASDLFATHNVSHDALKSQLEKKDRELKEQRSEIEEKDRIIEDLRRQVEQMNPRQNDKDDSNHDMQEVTKEALGIVESTSFSEEEDY